VRRLLTILLGMTALGVWAPAAQAAVDFEPFEPFPAPSPVFAAVGDLNGDGVADAVSASSGEISALIGDGDGTLQAARTTPSGGFISAVAAGDVTGDGRADVVATTPGAMPADPDHVRVYRSIGNGTFAAAVPVPTGENPQDVVLADIDRDRDLDMAVAEHGDNRASVFRNNGSGSFTAAPVVATVGQGPTDLAVADFNRDGLADLAISAKDGGTEAGISYAQGNGDGTFDMATNISVTDPEHLVAADFNGDGRADLATARRDVGDVVVVLRNAANTGFDAPVIESVGPGPGQPERLAAADLDGDGDPELAVPHTAGRLVVLSGGAGGGFSIGSQEPLASDGHEVAVADFNRDGNPDLSAAVGGGGANHVAILLAVPPIASTTPSLSFGPQQPGTESAAQTAVIRNNGAPRLRLSGAVLTGPNADQFRIVSNNCNGANLGIGGECSIGVTFRPTGNGARNASVAIGSNGAGRQHTVRLTGTGGLPVNPTGTCANNLNGTSAGETLTGTAFGDNIFGFAGNDVLNGLDGNDCLTGGTGNDRMNGGRGSDALEGGSGRDIGSGSSGNDRMTGGSSRDRLSGGSGRDTINGGSSHDRISGGSSSDRINGASGNDRLTGSSGNDRITGGSGRNTYSGGSGRDRINARNRRTERINCGSGRDTATVDRRDRVRGCERVRRSRR
jgi:Ca2+-binding RTX toxin-like protein